MGRPSKYKPEYCESIVKWFEEQVQAKELPFLSKWARTVAGVCEDTALEWTKQHEEFSLAYKKVKEIQKEFLIKGGLTGLFNPTFAIFTAKNITDMRDQTLIDHTTKGKELPTPIYGGQSVQNSRHNGNQESFQSQEKN